MKMNAVSARALPAWVGGLPDVRVGRWQPVSWHPTDKWLHDGKSFEIGELLYEDEGGRPLGVRLLVDPGSERMPLPDVYRGLDLLWSSGFRSPSPYRVPRPFTYDQDTGVLVREFIPGSTWADTVLGGDGRDAASDGVARWLCALQRLRVTPSVAELPRTPYPYRTAEQVAELQDQIGDRAAERRVEAVGREVRERLASSAGRPLVVSHGDLHPKNVLISGHAVVAIDTDRLALRDEGADPGRAMAQLISMSVARRGHARAGEAAAGRFWRSYRRSGGAATWPKTAPHVVATLIECVHYRVALGDNTWPGPHHGWIASWERILRGGKPW
ncbi:phosphotransferase [Streptomyces sp. PTM05]|uniref:Phosphotransferase n=1 Tax=Streptantibioticus parmotrematis TaxID=2873249 RepID=A0ABS7R1A5_9ACTN|nr:phosphotransferase [Streptantibioticus parmotrematis]MBY8889254.1 phosphotransferase [Streptantibioticus parmotrematis]